jgi:hypothetical protein
VRKAVAIDKSLIARISFELSNLSILFLYDVGSVQQTIIIGESYTNSCTNILFCLSNSLVLLSLIILYLDGCALFPDGASLAASINSLIISAGTFLD